MQVYMLVSGLHNGYAYAYDGCWISLWTLMYAHSVDCQSSRAIYIVAGA